MTDNPDRRQRWIAALLVAACLALNVYRARVVGMDRVVSYWAAQAVPAALSNLRFHHTHDYTGLVGVRELFGGRPPWQPTMEAVNRGIANVLSHRRQPIDRGPYLISPDDKGIVDFVELAFVLFGYRAESFLPLYWTILAATCLLFLLRFGDRPWAMALLLVFLLAHCSALPIVIVDRQLQSVVAPRFLSVLGIAATVHLVLEAWSGERLRPARWLGALGQTAILIFVLFLRSSAIWEVLCVVGASAVMLLRTWRREGEARRLLAAGLPALLVVGGTCGLSLYKRAAISSQYTREGSASHHIWFTIGSGLAYSPELASKFNIIINEVSISEATRRFLVERGQAQRWEQIGSSQQRFDEAVRDWVFATCHECPVEILNSVVYHKPRALALYVAWFLRLRPAPGYLEVLWPGARLEYQEMAAAMDRDDRAFRLFRPGCLLLLLAAALWACRSLRAHWREVAGVAGLLGLFSLIPSVMVYPIAHTINDALVCFGMLVYLGLMLGVSAVLGRAWQGAAARALQAR